MKLDIQTPLNNTISLQPRPYRDLGDFERMKHLLVEGRQADNGSYYVHVGDLSWWLFYMQPGIDRWQDIFLWDDPNLGDELIGWALFSPDYEAFDVYIHPKMLGTPETQEIFAWAEAYMLDYAHDLNAREIQRMWVFEGDSRQVTLLEQRGFTRKPEFLHYMSRSLAVPLNNPHLPDGFHVRHVANQAEAELRARVSYAAFNHSGSFDVYLQRYQKFMSSPVYTAGLDLIAITPDGRAAAFCICWLDAVNRVGLFEPVGTHPDFQRMGLGKAVIAEGLRRLKASGMTTAIVCAEANNLAAQKLYESAGFQKTSRLCTFAKQV